MLRIRMQRRIKLLFTIMKKLFGIDLLEAKRGFCGICGSSLFWSLIDGDTISIAAGSLEQPTGLKTTINIFTQDAGDYYSLDKDQNKLLPQIPQKPLFASLEDLYQTIFSFFFAFVYAA